MLKKIMIFILSLLSVSIIAFIISPISLFFGKIIAIMVVLILIILIFGNEDEPDSK